MAPMATIVTVLVLMTGWSHCYAALQSSSLPDKASYWKTKLPKTPIPSVIQSLLTSEVQKAFSLKYRKISPNINFIWKSIESMHFIDPNKAGYVLKKDLHPGTTVTMQLGRTIGNTGFLTRKAATSIPFSSGDIPQILTRFSVADPDSLEAKVIRQTLQICEAKAMDGETRRCATSLESMVDFAISTFGTSDIKVMQTSSSGMQKNTLLTTQPYTVVFPGPQQVSGSSSRSMACHPLTFPFAIYACHSLDSTEVYRVPLLGKDGTRIMAMATCHMNTSSWTPDHVSFQVLKAKPGAQVCHFLPEDNLVWVLNN